MPLVVAKGIVADKKPPIVTVFSKRSLLKFKRLAARETLMALLAQPFQILGVEDPCALVFSLHVLQSETGVIEHCLICVKGCPIRAQHVNETGDGVGHPRSEEHTSELQSHLNLVCRIRLEKKKIELIL